VNGQLQSPAASVEQPTRHGHVVDETRKLLRIPEICAMVGISRDTWCRWVRCGKAPKPLDRSVMPGHPRWKAADIAQFLDGRQVGRRHFFGGGR
jgi:predicted DNA-binding transcriptional regulator AlpA